MMVCTPLSPHLHFRHRLIPSILQVVTPSGFSYERAAIERYLTTAKAEDPQSRAPLTPAALVPNLGLKAAVESFLAAHPYAHPYVTAPPTQAQGAEGGS